MYQLLLGNPTQLGWLSLLQKIAANQTFRMVFLLSSLPVRAREAVVYLSLARKEIDSTMTLKMTTDFFCDNGNSNVEEEN